MKTRYSFQQCFHDTLRRSLFVSIVPFLLLFGCKKSEPTSPTPSTPTILHPSSGDVIYSDSKCVIDYFLPMNQKVRFEVSIDTGKTWEHKTILGYKASAYWLVHDKASKSCLLRMMDANDSILALSGMFEISSATGPTDYFLYPKQFDILYRGSRCKIKFKMPPPPDVAYDFSTNMGSSWREVIASGGAPEFAVDDNPADNCLLRMRAKNGSIVGTSGIFQISNGFDGRLYLSEPRTGATIPMGTLVKFIVVKPREPIFYTTLDWSTDGGVSWRQITRTISVEIFWMVEEGPHDDCRFRIYSDDRLRYFQTGSISIKNNLDEFFRLEVGMRMKFNFLHREGDLTSTDTFDLKATTYEIINQYQQGDVMYYPCRVTVEKTWRTPYTTISYDTIKEDLFGLHRFNFKQLSPLSDVPHYRYRDRSIEEENVSFSERNQIYPGGYSYSMKKGRGLLSHSSWYKTAMYRYNTRSYSRIE